MRPASSRNDIVTAAISSGYRPFRRELLFAFALVFDDHAGLIPGDMQPSLTDLGWLTGMSRASVKRQLNWLETAEPVRVRRDRPSVADARRYHKRTAYTVLVPDELGAGRAMAGLTLPQRLGAGRAMAGLTLPQRLGAPGTAVDDDARTTSAPWRDPEVVAVAAGELGRATGRQVSHEQAAEAVRQICEGREVRRPVPYLRRAIKEDARRWLPTPAPAPYQSPQPDDARLTTEQIKRIRETYSA